MKMKPFCGTSGGPISARIGRGEKPRGAGKRGTRPKGENQTLLRGPWKHPSGPDQFLHRLAAPKSLSRGGAKKELRNRKEKIKICPGSVESLLKNMIGRCLPGRLSHGDAKKELRNRKEKIQTYDGFVESLLKNIIGRCRPERLSQGGVIKPAPARKGKIQFAKGACGHRFKNLTGRCQGEIGSHKAFVKCLLGRFGPGNVGIGAGQAARQISTYEKKGG